MKEKYLPIGTVVILKEGKKELMITGYAIVTKGEIIDEDNQDKGKNIMKVFDYSAVTYPEGLISSNNTLGFNHDKIERIIYNGYETDQQKELSDKLKIEVEKFKKEMEKE